MVSGYDGNGSHPSRHLENVHLLAPLLGVAELLFGAAVCVSLVYVNAPTFESQAFSAAAAAVGTVFLVVSLIFIWNDSVIKPVEAERLVRGMPWGGDEVVADVTCGSGLIMERSAERLTSGLALGVDVWRRGLLGGWISPRPSGTPSGTSGATQAFADADSKSLPIMDGALDVVVSGFGTKRFRRLADRIAEVDEMVRALKPGGTIVLMVTGDPDEATVMLKRKGLVDINATLLRRFLVFPTRVISARKPTNFPT